MNKRLFRNEHDKVVAGVSSGIADYLEIDVTIIRLLFVLSSIFLAGTGVLVYIITWIVVPVNNDPAARFSKFNDFYKGQKNNPFDASNVYSQPQNANESRDWTSSTVNEDPFATKGTQNDFKPFQKNNDTGRMVGGLFLLVIGMYFLLNEFNIIPHWFGLGKLWPLIFVAIGVSFILKGKRKNDWETWKSQQGGTNPFNGPTDPGTPVNPEGPSVPVNPENGGSPENSGDQGSTINDRLTKH